MFNGTKHYDLCITPSGTFGGGGKWHIWGGEQWLYHFYFKSFHICNEASNIERLYKYTIVLTQSNVKHVRLWLDVKM